MNDKKMCDCNQGRMTCTCRDVIGEVIEEDSKRLTAPTVGEHAALEASPAALTIDQVELVGLVRDLALRSGKAARPLMHAAALELESQAREIERLRMQLVACGVVALANTPESAAKARDMHPDYMSASCGDVIRTVDIQMQLRAELAALKAQSSGVVLPEPEIASEINRLIGLWDAKVAWSGQCMEELLDHAARAATLIARLNSSPVRAGWMMPTAKQLEQALESVPSFHDLSAELIAPAMLGHLRDVISAGEYGDAYRGARDDMAIWKRRALEAETKVREQDQIIENLGNALNDENGPTFMGEPVLKARAALSAPSHGEQVRDRYTCIGKGGDYQLLGLAQGAGTLKGLNHMVYRNVDGVMFVREPEDFLLRMEKIAATPSAGSQKEQGE